VEKGNRLKNLKKRGDPRGKGGWVGPDQEEDKSNQKQTSSWEGRKRVAWKAKKIGTRNKILAEFTNARTELGEICASSKTKKLMNESCETRGQNKQQGKKEEFYNTKIKAGKGKMGV